MMVALRPTPLAPFGGVTEVTVGAVLSVPLPAVKVVTTYALSVLPARSCTSF